MKKIVFAAAAVLMLAGAAFADVSFSYEGTGIVGGTSKALDKVTRKDCFGLTISSDIVGVCVDWDVAQDKPSLDSYYGWITYGLPVGNLQITSGKWDARYVNRVKKDAGSLGSDYYEANKPGVINGTVGKDSDNLTMDKKMSTVLAYTLAETLPGTLMVKVGAVNGTYDKYDSQSNFVGEICWDQKGLVNANVAFRSFKSDTFSVGAFVSPLMLDKLDSMVGFTYAKNDSDSEWGADARARYVVSEKVAVTGMVNYSKTEITKCVNGKDPLKTLWTMASVSYVAGNNITFKATAQNTVRDFTASYGKNLTVFTPACEIKATENCTVTAAFDVRWDDKTPYAGVGDVSLPIYVSISL